MNELVQRWEHRLPTHDDVATTPTPLDAKRVVFGINPQDGATPKSDARETLIRAVAIKDGATLWERRLPPSASARILHPPTLLDGALFVSTAGALLRLDPKNGEVLWTTALDESIEPCTAPGAIVAGNRNELVALDPATGAPSKTRRKKLRVKWLVAAVPGGEAGIFAATSDAKVFLVDATTFEPIREYRVPGGASIGVAPVVHEGMLLVNSYGAFFKCFAIATGEVVWRKKKAPGRLGVCRLGEGGALYYSTPALVCMDVVTRRERWTFDEPVVHFAVRGAEVAALVIREDWAYELVRIAGADGAVIQRLALGAAPQLSRDLWQENGFVALGDQVISSHAAGAVVGLASARG